MATIISAGALVVDASTAHLGRFKARSKQIGKQKLRVLKEGRDFFYDIGMKDIMIPLQMGDGNYDVILYRNLSGNRYTKIGAARFPVTLSNEFVPYLNWNQYVNYEYSKTLIAHTRLMCQGMGKDEAAAAIKEEIENKYSYDYIRSVMVEKGMMPDIDRCFNKKMGICQDFAALAVAMFRVVGIPAKMVIGTFGNDKHAWCEVYQDGKWNLYDPTMKIQKLKKKKRYVKERWY